MIEASAIGKMDIVTQLFACFRKKNSSIWHISCFKEHPKLSSDRSQHYRQNGHSNTAFCVLSQKISRRHIFATLVYVLSVFQLCCWVYILSKLFRLKMIRLCSVNILRMLELCSIYRLSVFLPSMFGLYSIYIPSIFHLCSVLVLSLFRLYVLPIMLWMADQ